MADESVKERESRVTEERVIEPATVVIKGVVRGLEEVSLVEVNVRYESVRLPVLLDVTK